MADPKSPQQSPAPETRDPGRRPVAAGYDEGRRPQGSDYHRAGTSEETVRRRERAATLRSKNRVGRLGRR
jgi:hypothetical protein